VSYSTNYYRGNPLGMNVSGSTFVTAHLPLEAGKYAVKKAERNGKTALSKYAVKKAEWNGKTALRSHDSQNW